MQTKYGRLHHPDLEKPIELDDDAKVAAILKLLAGKWGLKPVARLEFENIEMTLEAEDKQRRIISQLSAGLERQLFRGLVFTGGANFRRHQPEDEIQHQGNADLRTRYETRIKGLEIKSEIKLFLIILNTALEENKPFKDYIATISASAKLPLNRFLFLSTDAVLYRESQKGPWAHNANIAIQFRQSWGKKG